MATVDSAISILHGSFAVNLTVEPISLICATVTPDEFSLALHLVMCEGALIASPIGESVATLPVLGPVLKLAFVEGAIVVLLTAFTVELTVDLGAVLLCSLPSDRLAHGHYNLRLIALSLHDF